MSDVVEVCNRCKGAGIEPTNPRDKLDKPPIIICRDCDGSGVPTTLKATLSPLITDYPKTKYSETQ